LAKAGDATAGQAKAAACVGCHGAEGVSVNLPGPTLAGQHEAYLLEALKAYITSERTDPMMSAGVQGLSDDDAANIAAYFAGVKCASSLDTARQATLPGKAAVAKCTACHGTDGSSTNPSWPSLVGQSKAYLVNALKAYKGGTRKNGMMGGVAKGLSDADMEDVAAYYANATCK
jgi:cytochrome c553